MKTVMAGSGNNVSKKKLTNSYRIVVSQLRKEFDNIMYGDVKISDKKQVKKTYYIVVDRNRVPVTPSVIQRREWGDSRQNTIYGLRFKIV